MNVQGRNRGVSGGKFWFWLPEHSAVTFLKQTLEIWAMSSEPQKKSAAIRVIRGKKPDFFSRKPIFDLTPPSLLVMMNFCGEIKYDS
jgi:hypothetical protein